MFRSIAGIGEMLQQLLIELEPTFRGALHPLELQKHDISDQLAIQRFKHDVLIDTIDELGSEVMAHHFHDLTLQGGTTGGCSAASAALLSLTEPPLDDVSSEIARRNEDRIGKIYHEAFSVSEPSVIEDTLATSSPPSPPPWPAPTMVCVLRR
jgi:hypothetical protein